MVAIRRCSWQMRLIIDFFLIPYGRDFLAKDSHVHLFFHSLHLNLLVSPPNCWHIASCQPQACPGDSQIRHYGVGNLQMHIYLSKSCINDHKLKWAAKEVTSWSQFSQRKNKRTEDQNLNGLKKNLRMLILNTSKFTNRGLFNFCFLPLTSKKI